MAKPYFFALLFVLLFASCHIEARQSKFFAKYIHFSSSSNNNGNKNYITVPSTIPESHVSAPVFAPTLAPASAPVYGEIGPAPALAPVEGGNGYAAPAPAPAEVGDGYGLYGRDFKGFPSAESTTTTASSKFPYEETSTTTATYPVEEDEFSNEEFSAPSFEEMNSRESNNYESNRNRYSSLNYNNNGYSSNNNYEGYTNGYDPNSYVTEPQGMSDTRTLENGRYYYNVKNENYLPNNRDESERGSSNEEGYYGYNQKSKYEFDSMEEYEKQERFADPQRYYIP